MADPMKKRKGLLAAAVVLVLLLAAGLWYTRPQKLIAVLGGGQPANLSASLSDLNPIFDNNGMVTSNIDVWLLNGVEAGDAAMDEIMSILEDATCRASLLSLIPRDSYSHNGARGSFQAGIVWDDQSFSSFTLNSDGHMTMGSNIGWDIYHVDLAVFDALAAVVQEYGTFQERN